jgi:hypothetical protein
MILKMCRTSMEAERDVMAGGAYQCKDAKLVIMHYHIQYMVM